MPTCLAAARQASGSWVIWRQLLGVCGSRVGPSHCPMSAGFFGGNKPMCSGDEQIAERTGPVVPCSRGGLVSKFKIVAWSEHDGWLVLYKLWIPLPPRPPGCQPASLGDKSTSFDAQSATVEDAGATGTVYRTMSGLWKDPRLAELRRKGTFNRRKVGSPPHCGMLSLSPQTCTDPAARHYTEYRAVQGAESCPASVPKP